MRTPMLILLALLPMLAACGSDKRPVQSASVPVAPAPRPQTRQHSRVPPVRQPLRPPVQQHAPAPRPQAAPGLEGVIGASQAELVRQFGTPRLDVWEGDARKLQFSGTACVLDVYLYLSAAGRERQASYVDARRASDGKDVDRATCIAALRQRGTPHSQQPIAPPGG